MNTFASVRSSSEFVLAIAMSFAAWGADAGSEASGSRPAGVSTNGLLGGFRLEWSWPDATNAPQLLQEMRKNPDSTATPLFEMAASDAASKLSTLNGEQREARAAQLIPMLREANTILDAAIQANPGNTNLPVYRLLLSFDLPAVLFEAGTNDLDEVRTLTQQILDRNTNTSLPFYDPFRFTANELLGRVALRQKKPEEARAYLRAAGKVLVASMVDRFSADRDTQAPLVNKFSDLHLARELLEHGEKKDREAVLAFLDELVRSIRSTPLDARSQRVAAADLKQLDEWRRQIRDGKIPSDPKSLAQSEAPPDVARLKHDLLGNWAVDQEATANSMARGKFGPQSTVTVSGREDSPATIRTNFTSKPFNQQEYEQAKRILLESFRANDHHTWMTFAPDGTGTESELGDSGTRSNMVQFHWSLQGTTLKVEFPNKKSGADFQTEFTDTNRLCRPMPFLRACMFFKRAPGGAER